MADDNITIKFISDTKDAIQGARDYRAEIEKSKEQIKEVAEQAKVSYKEAAEAMKKAYEQQAKAKVEPLLGPGTKASKEAFAAAKAEAQDYAKSVVVALKEIEDAEKRVIATIKEEPAAHKAALDAYIAKQKLVTTKARTAAREERIGTELVKSKATDSALVSEANAQSKAQIAAARAIAVEETKAQEIIRAEIKTTTEQRISAAKIAIQEAKAQAEAEVARAKVLAANSGAVKAAAEADKAQAEARKAQAQAIQQEAKAANAAALEAAKVRQAQAAADQAVANAQITAANAAVAAQAAQARADQQSAIAAQQDAKAQIAESDAILKSAEAAKADELAQEKLAQAQAKTAQATAQAAAAQTKAAQAGQPLQAQTGKFTGMLGSLNGLLRLTFGTALGITAIQAISKFRESIKEAIALSEQFTKVQFGLALALREIQRRGGDVDFDKVGKEIDALYAKFGVFSKKEITQSFTDVALRLSRFGATAEQVGKIVDIALVLKMTDVENRFDSVDEAAKVLATYLGSGYGEGLERAGAIAGRSADQLIAFENGMKTLYGASIDPLERAMLRINFLFRQFSGQMDDAGKYVETASGRIDKAQSKINDATVKLGDSFLGVTVKIKESWADFVSNFATVMAPMIVDTIITLMATFDAFGVKFKEFQDSLNLTSPMDKWIKEQDSFFKFLNTALAAAPNDPRMQKGYAESVRREFEAYETQAEKFKKLKELYPKEYDVYVEASKALDKYVENTDEKFLTLGELIRKFKNDTKKEFDAMNKDYTELFSTPPTVEGPITGADTATQQMTKDIQDEITKEIKDAEKERLDLEKDFWDDMGKVGTAALPGLIDAWNAYFAQSSDITVQGLEQQQALWEQGYGEFGNILNDALDKAMDIWRDYYDKLADIAMKEMQDIADENREYQQRLEDNRRDMQQKLEDAARKYREAELKAERDYQEKMRRLREEFLFDLEDALRERDALQVIRLMRRYALDKEQAEREHDNEAQDRAEAYRQELADIRRQAARKEEELRIEHQRRLEEIALQADREREQAQIERDREIEALKQDIEKEKAQREEKYAADKKALEDSLNDRITTIIQKYVEENNLTSAQLTSMSTTLQTWATNTINTHWNVANQIAAATASIIASLQAQQAAQAAATSGATYQPPSNLNYGNLSPGGVINPGPSMNPYMPYGTHYASGGIGYATTPTWALYGEAGPEIATFTPVSKINTNSMSPVGSNGLGGGGQAGGMSGRIRVEVALSRDLIGKVIDDTLSQSAQIIESALSERG